MQLSDLFSDDDLRKALDEGYVSVQRHPSLPLRIYNYTHKAQFDQMWTNVTRQCRGLITDEDGEIVARPFAKFFNLEEHPRSDIVFSKPFHVTEKVDGSLGIVHWNGERWAVATRGSFMSDQAVHATKRLESYIDVHDYYSLYSGMTYLVEIIYPENRIVIDYRGADELRLIAIIDTETGDDVNVYGTSQPFPMVASPFVAGVKPRDIAGKFGVDDGNHEGFVLVFDYPPGKTTRVKVKLEEYKRLHRILSGLTAKAVWEVLSTNGSIIESFEAAPDEAYSWVKGTAHSLRQQYAALEEECQKEYERLVIKSATVLETTAQRKQFAKNVEASRHAHRSIMWRMYDGRSYDDLIWREIKPAHVPFSSTQQNEEA